MINHAFFFTLLGPRTYLSVLSLYTERDITMDSLHNLSRSGNDLAVKEKIVPDKSTKAVEDKPSK